MIKKKAPRARRVRLRGKPVLQGRWNEGLKVFTSVPSGMEGALLCSVVALCRHKLALAGYEFCILTLEEKIAKQKDLPEDVLPAEEKANTRLLLGMSLDSYARYLLNVNQLPVAQKMYEKALQISNDVQGETHPQTVVLMNDLATVLDAQGHYDEAYSYVKRAAELAKETQHPEEHMVLNNLAAILMHKEDFLQAKQVYKAALEQAQQKGDVASVQHIQEELAELAKRRKGSK
ncbi:tetratricopeptide repeat protein 19, mitochondrial isoform X3 [Strix uralensis]|uniref:tetratricopeptide repeat protein 19, mitochondrial isoform X3 n=1 Tax=Strix uralensis TaxID=36305 RepID=UPI003DA76C7F